MEGAMGDFQDVGDVERDVGAVRAAVAELEPPSLRDRTVEYLADKPMGAGRLVRHAAATEDGHVPKTALDDRVVGVQLIYSGLGLIRELAREPPWEHGDGDAGDLDVLVAEVLVAKGFSLLASTPAASKAVETVQTLARSETVRLNCAGPRTALETDIFELGVLAGITTTEELPPDDIDGVADRVATRLQERDDQEVTSFVECWQAASTSSEDQMASDA